MRVITKYDQKQPFDLAEIPVPWTAQPNEYKYIVFKLWTKYNVKPRNVSENLRN